MTAPVFLRDLYQTADEVLALSHAQLAKVVVTQIVEKKTDRPIAAHRSNSAQLFAVSIHAGDLGFAKWPERTDEVKLAWAEAWQWMHREILLLPLERTEYATLSRAGAAFILADGQFESHANRIARAAVHPALREGALHSFWRANYDTSVFECFKAVEVAVREAAGYGASDIGVSMVRKAFNVETGPLTDLSLVVGEREGMQHLFAGAMGFLKNPTSHRYVEADAETAADMIAFASYLLRLVDARKRRP